MLGHRGARERAPENTLEAFALALDEGAAGTELDVRLDGDERVVVLHDATLERVSGGVETRHAEALSTAELARVDLGGGARVPLLDDALRLAWERGARLNVELKRDVRRPHALLLGVRRAVQRSRLNPEQLLFSSFQPLFVSALALLLPESPRALLVHPEQSRLMRGSLFRRLGADGINPHHRLIDAASIARWKEGPALVSAWTVNEPDDARRLSALAVDVLISDRPGLVLRALEASPAA